MEPHPYVQQRTLDEPLTITCPHCQHTFEERSEPRIAAGGKHYQPYFDLDALPAVPGGDHPRPRGASEDAVTMVKVLPEER